MIKEELIIDMLIPKLYFVVKFISIVMAFKVFFRKKNMSTATFLTNNKTTQIFLNCHIESMP